MYNVTVRSILRATPEKRTKFGSVYIHTHYSLPVRATDVPVPAGLIMMRKGRAHTSRYSLSSSSVVLYNGGGGGVRPRRINRDCSVYNSPRSITFRIPTMRMTCASVS